MRSITMYFTLFLVSGQIEPPISGQLVQYIYRVLALVEDLIGSSRAINHRVGHRDKDSTCFLGTAERLVNNYVSNPFDYGAP